MLEKFKGFFYVFIEMKEMGEGALMHVYTCIWEHIVGLYYGTT